MKKAILIYPIFLKLKNQNIVSLNGDTFNYVQKLLKDCHSFDTYGKLTYFQPNTYLFPSPKTKHYGRGTPNDWLLRFFDRNEEELQKRGFHRISPHGFRHSQATLLYKLGFDPKDAPYRLRHKNLKTTMDIYPHLSEQKKRSPIVKLEQFWADGAIFGTTFSETKKTTLRKRCISTFLKVVNGLPN